jgi:hypothetical protein
MDLNIGTVTVSLNYILQISLYWITHKILSSQQDCQLNSQCHLLNLLCKAQLSINCSLGTRELECRFSTKLFFITTWHRPNRKHRSQKFLYCCVSVAAKTCLPSRCLATDVSCSTIPAFSHHVTT